MEPDSRASAALAGLTRRRMSAARLIGPPFGAPAEVVRWFGAVQSQDYGPAKWSVGQRLAAATDADLDRAFGAGTFVRTHVLRPTWHFVLPEDLRWLLALTSPRVHGLNAYYYRQEGLEPDVRARSERVLADALAGGNALTRKEISAVLASAGLPAEGLGLGLVLVNAELEAVVCSGPMQGRRHTYTLLDERVPPGRDLRGDAALAELTRRYFTSHGPSTVQAFRAWSSLTVRDINRGLDLVGEELARETVDNVTYWFTPGPEVAAPPSPDVQLLQAYDEYVVTPEEGSRLFDLAGFGASRSRRDLPFYGIVLLDGQLAGRWKRTVVKASLRVDVALYRPLTGAQSEALAAAAARHGEFLGELPVDLVTRPL
jgi:hypothetical protein